MGKTINVHETCVVTKDDKGSLSLVGKAKEALTSLSKHKVAVNILLSDGKKEDIEKFLKDNNVPFTSVLEKGEDNKDSKVDVTVMPSSKVVTLEENWSWCLDSIVRRLWGDKKTENPRSEQQAMDDRMNDYIKYASPKKNNPIQGDCSMG